MDWPRVIASGSIQIITITTIITTTVATIRQIITTEAMDPTTTTKTRMDVIHTGELKNDDEITTIR